MSQLRSFTLIETDSGHRFIFECDCDARSEIELRHKLIDATEHPTWQFTGDHADKVLQQVDAVQRQQIAILRSAAHARF